MEKPGEQKIPDKHDHLIKFLDSVFRKDQSDPHRNNAPECYQMLIDRQKEFIGTPMENAFWNAVSLETFHIAQNEAIKGDTESALRYLEISYNASQKGINREWESYVKGTKCYFENDIEGLQGEIPKAGENEKVLRRLLNGYLSRDSTNYKEDY